MATTDKYDRQLRLWGASGQRALGQTLVALIGTSACGTEALKNLVLPGVGSILVVDDDDEGGMDNATPTNVAHGTTKSDDNASLFKFALANSNFFLSPKDPSTTVAANDDDDDCPTTSSSSNAARAATLLCELNPDVHGQYLTVPSLEEMDYQSFLTSLLLVESSYGSSAVQMTTMTSTNNSKKSLLIIAADQPSSVLLPLSHACYMNSIPLIAIRSYGLLGTVRVQTPSPYHPIIESRPSVRKPDLRLGTMPLFDTLQAVCETVSKLDSIVDTKDRSHVPFVIILLQALDKWRNGHSSGGENGGNEEKTDEAAHKPPPPPSIPKTMAEKDDFRSIVKNMANNINNEINFEEAMRLAHLVWADDQLSEDVQSVIDKVDEMSFFRNVIIESPDDNNMDVDGATSGSGSISGGAVMSSHVLQFQLLIVALKRYLLANNNYPPLEGTIPDMTSDTSRFVALQEAYRSRAEADRAQLCNIITSLLDECKEQANGCALRIAMPSDDVIQTFCKNVRYLRMLETRPLYAEYILQDKTSPVVTSYSAMFDSMKLSSSEGSSSSSSNTINNFDTLQSDARDDLQSSTMDPYETDPVQTPLLWWIALRACDAFYDRHQHYPGKHDQELALEADANEVYSCMLEIVQSSGLVDGENTSELIKEYILDKVKGKDLAREVVRYDEAEIHTVAAVVGGVASQEAVKLITGQYVPIDDTYVYNGIASTAGVYRF